VYGELLQDFCLARVKVEPHLTQPFKCFGTRYPVSNEAPCHCAFVDKFIDLKYEIQN
jgi:hypothetical protein